MEIDLEFEPRACIFNDCALFPSHADDGFNLSADTSVESVGREFRKGGKFSLGLSWEVPEPVYCWRGMGG